MAATKTSLADRVQELVKRLRHLENLESIRKILARYCLALDSEDINCLQSVFSRDAELQVVPWSIHHQGREAIVKFYKQFFESEMKDGRHYYSNEYIQAVGEGYESFCYFYETVERGEESLIGWGTYQDRFIMEEGAWKIRNRLITILALTAVQQGWARREATIPEA